MGRWTKVTKNDDGSVTMVETRLLSNGYVEERFYLSDVGSTGNNMYSLHGFPALILRDSNGKIVAEEYVDRGVRLDLHEVRARKVREMISKDYGQERLHKR